LRENGGFDDAAVENHDFARACVDGGIWAGAVVGLGQGSGEEDR
jgi:hypothetical protein